MGSKFQGEVGFKKLSGMEYWSKYTDIKGMFPSQSK